MADISIEQAKAKQWILDVKNELNSVETVLRNVSTACTTIPGEDDDIIKGIVETGEAMRNFWDQMCSGFKQATDLVDTALDKIGQVAETVIQDIGNVKSKIGS